MKPALEADSWTIGRGEAFASDTLDEDAASAPRQFGQPVDAEAQAEIAEAVAQEEGQELPLFLTAGQEGVVAAEAAPARAPEADRFADLIYAARNNAVEYEPEVTGKREPKGAGIRPLLVVLLIVAVVALAIAQHRLVIHSCPPAQAFSKS